MEEEKDRMQPNTKNNHIQNSFFFRIPYVRTLHFYFFFIQTKILQNLFTLVSLPIVVEK